LPSDWWKIYSIALGGGQTPDLLNLKKTAVVCSDWYRLAFLFQPFWILITEKFSKIIFIF